MHNCARKKSERISYDCSLKSGSSPGPSPGGSPKFFRRKQSTPKPPVLEGHPIFNRPTSSNVSFRLSSKYKGRVRPKGGYKKAEMTIDPNDKFAEVT